jgi:hypothetical protein
MFNARSGSPSFYLAHVSQLQILSINFLRGLRQLPRNTAMCECLGCSGCNKIRVRCCYDLGRYKHQKLAKRCHWCYDAAACNPSDAAACSLSDAAACSLSDAVTTHVPATEVSTWATNVNSASRRSTPLKVKLFIDSVGRLKSRARDYIHEVQTRLAFQYNVILSPENIKIFSGGDLPEIAAYFEEDDCCSGTCDLILIILMSNYAASTLGQHAISDPMVRACSRLQKIAESVPTYVIYGGSGEMWPNVVSSGGQNCFDTKTKLIRDLLASSGRIKVNSGADDFSAFFDISDLDYMGHIKGTARDKAIRWMAKQISDVSNDHCQVMQPNVQHGLPPVEDPLATKFALIGFSPLKQVKIPADWLPRPLSHEMPHVFLLSGPDERCAAQQNAASKMFKQLGWEPKLVSGIARDVKLPHPRSHWAWACRLIPKLKKMIAASNCSDDETVLLGEDSCWPTTSCTPQQVREWMEDALRQGYQGIWIGAAGGMKRRRFSMRVNSQGQREDQPCEVKAAPCGSKLFAITIRQLRLMEQVWGWVPQDWFVDGVNHLLAASGQLMVRETFLAGSMQHFSMRSGRSAEKHVTVHVSGTLLPEGHLVDHCVQLSSMD